jgi:hypothetical protein
MYLTQRTGTQNTKRTLATQYRKTHNADKKWAKDLNNHPCGHAKQSTSIG